MRYSGVITRLRPAALAFSLPVFLLVSSCSLGVAVKAPEPMRSSVECEPGRCLGDAVRLLKEGRGVEAETLLAMIRIRSAGADDGARASFLLGRLTLDEARRTDGRVASGPYAAVDDADGLLVEALDSIALRPYALMELARARFLAGRFEESATLCRSLVSLYPDSPLAPVALHEATDAVAGAAASAAAGGDAVLAAGLYAEAIDGLRLYIAAAGPRGAGQEPYLKGAVYSMLTGDEEGAASLLKEAMVRHPDDRAWRTADESLAAMTAPSAAYSSADRRRMAFNLYNAAEYDRAAKVFRLLLEDEGAEARDESTLLLAKSLMRKKRHDEAARALRNFIAVKPAAPEREAEALNLLALIALKEDDEAGLLKALDALGRSHKESRFTAEALLYLGRLYDGRGDAARSLEAYISVMENPAYASTEFRDESSWRVGWIYYRAGRFLEAAGVFKSLASSGRAGSENKRERFAYWAARSIEKTGASVEAEAGYSALCTGEPDGYYCRMAKARGFTHRIASASSSSALRGAEARPAGIEGDERYKRASELVLLGLNKEASAELKSLVQDYRGEGASLLGIAALFTAAGDYNGAMTVGYRLPEGYNEAARRLSWPEDVVGFVRKADPDSFADPRLVASVMREESSFKAETVSKAGAIGLMQIMPATGASIARSLERAEPFDPAELFRPETSVRYGSWYLAELKGKFKGDVVLAVAAYNAGPQAVARWLKGRPADDDEFIESIPYAETRYYVKRVIRSYAEFTGHPTLPGVRAGAIERVASPEGRS